MAASEQTERRIQRRHRPDVFISGTFADIKRWRQIARDILVGREFFPKDLSITADRSELVRDLIDRELDGAEIYLGIFGHRYGSRVDNVPQNPSWTHYEFNRFVSRIEEMRPYGAEPDMLILHPAMPSPAVRDFIAGARDATRDLDSGARRRDREAQKAFLRTARGGAADRTGVEPLNDGDWVRVPTAQAARIVQTFANDDQFENRIIDFLWLYERDMREAEGRSIDVREEPPASAVLPVIPAPVLTRLRASTPPPGLCVVVPRLDGAVTGDVAEALVQANPWDVEDIDKYLDASAESVQSIDNLFSMFAEEAFGARGDDTAARISSIASEVVEDGYPRTYRILGLKPGWLKIFIRDFWTNLEKAIRTKRLASAGSDGALLLILTVEASPLSALKLCQTFEGAKAQPLEKPLLITSKSLGLEVDLDTPAATSKVKTA